MKAAFEVGQAQRALEIAEEHHKIAMERLQQLLDRKDRVSTFEQKGRET